MDEKLEYLELHITDSCNLNCKGCSHCAGLVAQGQHIPLESYKNDLKRLKEFIPEIRKLRLLGGEPFLNPEISEYVTWARKVYPDSDIRVVTNGLLCLKADKKIYQALRENQVMLDISCYPPTEKIKEKLEALFVQEGVAFRFSAPIEKFAKRVNLQGDSDAEAAFWDCDSKWCNFLRNGILCTCPAPVILDVLGEYYHFRIDTSAGKLNIYDENMSSGKILEFLNHPGPMCAYCTELEMFDWKGNAVPQLSDWVVR